MTPYRIEYIPFRVIMNTGMPAMTDEELDIMRSIRFPDDHRVEMLRVPVREPLRYIPPSTKHLDVLKARFRDSFYAREKPLVVYENPEQSYEGRADGSGRG